MNTRIETRLIGLALFFGLGIFAVLFAAGFWLTDGAFSYPLDDTYIHLSMGEQIASGRYGINPNEYASADSSILYPVLLAPFSGTGFHVYLPLILNALALALALVLVAKLVAESGLLAAPQGKWFAIMAVLLAPIAFNFQGLSLLGMEHMLHVDTALLALLGVLRMQKTGQLNGLLVAAILLGPLLRYEALGLSLVLCLAVLWQGHWKAGILLTIGALGPVIGFGLWMKSVGMAFLPYSVMAKATIVETDESVIWTILGHNFAPDGAPVFATLVIVLSLGFLFIAFSGRPRFARNHRIVAFVAGSMGLGHAFLGKFGWANRYEIYAVAFLGMAALLVLAPLMAQKTRAAALAKIAAVGAMIFGFAYYIGFTVVWAINGPANIYNQQWQMSEILDKFDGGPVLVNDIGLVSYQSDTRIVDIFGLASIDALNARRNHARKGWLNQLAIKEGAGMAMMYDPWFKRDLGPGWTPIAYLDLTAPAVFLSPRVTIYATRDDMVAPIRALLKAQAPQLPRFASFEFVDPSPQSEESPSND